MSSFSIQHRLHNAMRHIVCLQTEKAGSSASLVAGRRSPLVSPSGRERSGTDLYWAKSGFLVCSMEGEGTWWDPSASQWES